MELAGRTDTRESSEVTRGTAGDGKSAVCVSTEAWLCECVSDEETLQTGRRFGKGSTEACLIGTDTRGAGYRHPQNTGLLYMERQW